MSKIKIEGEFSAEQLEGKHKSYTHTNTLPKYLILPHEGFEIVELPNKALAKYAYNKLYKKDTTDLDIELEHIARYEPYLEKTSSAERKEAKLLLKFHYKRAISIITPKIAAGWNRWSESILELFLSEKVHKVVWGSGNCGKSVIMAVLLYTKWRVKPNKRMVVIASRVMKDASARVFGYIKDIHVASPECSEFNITMVENQREKGIFCQMYDEKEGKWIKDDRACIINLPIKVNAKNAEVGSNLLGKHPDDRLILAFDEAQELPATMANDKIFVNWYTNKRLDVYAWGNPVPVDYYEPTAHDLLFKLGAEKLSIAALRNREKEADRSSVWGWSDTTVLHLSMLDSPKDDSDEINYMVDRGDGTTDQRLHFLAGKDSVERIAKKISPQSASWYYQVLGFPFIDTAGSKQETVLNGFIIKKTQSYPLHWRTPVEKLQWYMGVDPAVTGKRDAASIVCGRMGQMMDGRLGIDLMQGKACRQIVAKEGEDFTDTIINTMWNMCLEYNIPLKRVAIETHGVGEVLRYAIQNHIEDGKWSKDRARGENYYIVNPTIGPTDRWLFKSLGNMIPAKEMCSDIITEYWVAVRCAVLTRQLFNVPDYILKQFYNRYLLRNGAGTKYKVESKDQMKKRGVPSPNDGDAICNMMELMRQHGFSYKFYNKGSYDNKFGPEYDYKQKQAVIGERLTMVSGLLGIAENLGNYADVRTRKSGTKRSGDCDIDGV